MENKNFVDFTGGVNYVDSELNMRDSYAVEALNVELAYDSTIKKRNGFKLVNNIHEYLLENEKLQEIFYFELKTILYTNQGRVLSMDDENTVEVIWDESIAQSISSETHIWGNPTERCFGTAAGSMFILSNGVNKPLQIDFHPNDPTAQKVQYLHDPGTGGNANVPIIYKARMVNHYLCAAVLGSNTIHISAKDVPGLWEDDTEGEQAGATSLNIDSIVGIPNQNIIDVATYKNMLCVFTDYHIIIVELDVYVDRTEDGVTTQVHSPTVNMVVDNAGCATTGSVQSSLTSLLFLSVNGINSIERNAISTNFVPTSLSEKILPFIKSKLSTELFDTGVWSVVDRQKYVYMVKFLDNDMICMSFHPNLRFPCFYIWNNVKYKSFTTNVHGRVLCIDDYGVYIYTDNADGYCVDDHIDDEGTEYSTLYSMEYETPWLFYGKPNNIKSMEYFNIISDGTAQFTVKAAFDVKQEWELQQDFIGGSMQGFGAGQNRYYGGGLISGTENLCEFPQVFMYNKFRIESSDDRPLRIIRFGCFYNVGGIRR